MQYEKDLLSQNQKEMEQIYQKILRNLDDYFSVLQIGSNLHSKYVSLLSKNNDFNFKKVFLKVIQYAVFLIDILLDKQLNLIIHNKKFQTLESSWRGLMYLVSKSVAENIKIKLLDVSWDVLSRDLKFSLEFDQTQLFKKIYDKELDMPGGEPFGLLIGDYYVSHKSINKDGIKHIETLQLLAKIGEYSFVPFVISADPSLLEVDCFANLHPWIDITRTFQQEAYNEFKNFSKKDESKFIYLVLPKVLMRPPYKINDIRKNNFCFKEKMILHDDYLWGNTVYYFAGVIIRSYQNSGWFYELTGVSRGKNIRGVVSDLNQHSLVPDGKNNFDIAGLECFTSEFQEQKLSAVGLITLATCKYTNNAAFYSCHSIYRPRAYESNIDTGNENISSKLTHLLCTSRFAHYIKVIMREKIGLFLNHQECEDYLQKWIINYTATGEYMSNGKIQYPLQTAKISIKPTLGKPGVYACLLSLLPHMEVDEVKMHINFTVIMSI